MQGFPVCTVFDLMTTAGAGSSYQCLRRSVPYRREKDQLTYLHGQIIMFFLKTERPRHTATSGRDLLHNKIFGDGKDLFGMFC